MHQLEPALTRRDYAGAAPHVHESLKWLPKWVREVRAEGRGFTVQVIPALERGGTALALIGDREGLAEMRRVVESEPELRPWIERVRQHEVALRLVPQIEDLIRARPVCLQNEVNTLLGSDDGRLVGRLIQYLEKAGRIARVRTGRTWRLLPPESPYIPPPRPKRRVRSHRSADPLPDLIEVANPKRTVHLPPSPHRWDLARDGHRPTPVPVANAPFETTTAAWGILGARGLAPRDRPDPAFRRFHPTHTGLVAIDDLAHADGIRDCPAAAVIYDRRGRAVAKAPLLHDAFQRDVHPLGNALIAVSREGIVHAYDSDLQPLFETALREAPEAHARRARRDIPADQSVGHSPYIAISADSRRYLHSMGDEAWCIAIDGRCRWAVEMPEEEGWVPASNLDVPPRVHAALQLLDLELPVTPEQVNARYKALALIRHPDVNPDDPSATERMKNLNQARDVLRNVNEATLTQERTGFIRESSVREYTTPFGTLRSGFVEHRETIPRRQISAVAFAADSDAAFIGDYSGRVHRIRPDGKADMRYEIGGPPLGASVRRIVSIGDYLYIATQTTLYVLHGSSLRATMNIWKEGELFVTRRGFGLSQPKQFRWFGAGGDFRGSILSHAPIRRIYPAGENIVVETRTRRAFVSGANMW